MLELLVWRRGWVNVGGERKNGVKDGVGEKKGGESMTCGVHELVVGIEEVYRV
jgi:hypothetical protein